MNKPMNLMAIALSFQTVSHLAILFADR